MSDESLGWSHAGISLLKRDSSDRESRYVRVPNRVFQEEDILLLGHDVDWYVNEGSGVLIVTHNRLDQEEYEYTGKSTKFSEGDSKYGLTVPKPFYDENRGIDGTDVVPHPIDKVQLTRDEALHFIYQEGMATGTKKSCYVLTEEQFDKRFSDSDKWDGSLDQVPKFF